MTLNPYYNPSGTPGTGSPGASSTMRAEFTAVAAGFALFPAISGNASKAVVVNNTGSALTTTTGTFALAGNFATTGAFNTTFAQSASVTLNLPSISDTLATLGGTETLSNKTLVAPALGTPASGILTNCTGTAAGLIAGGVTTNANLTGPITSSGNTTSVASQTGTGSTFVMNTSPTLVTPVIGAATGTSLSVSGQLTSTVATGTAPLVVSSTTAVSNLNASLLLGSTWASPGAIGGTSANTGAFTTLSATSTVMFATLSVTSTVALTTPLTVGSGGTGAATLTGILKGNGTSAFSAASAGTDYPGLASTNTFTALQTFTGSASVLAASLVNAKEPGTISATAATGTINFDFTVQSVIYYTSSASANWTVNFRASSSATLNSVMNTGDMITGVFAVTQGSPAFYNNVIQVDGTTSGVTVKWQGGIAPTSGNASGIDVYSYTIAKTGSAAYTIFASQVKFA